MVIKKIRKEIKNGSLEQLISIFIKNQKDDLLTEENGIKYQITSTYNQNNKEYRKSRISTPPLTMRGLFFMGRHYSDHEFCKVGTLQKLQ